MRNEILILARKKSGKTQKQIAKELRISEIAYKKYEYGTRTPNVKVANSIAKALGTTSENLWGYKENNRESKYLGAESTIGVSQPLV